MAAWRSGYIEANGIRIHYTRTGGGKPPVVLAHGFTDDGLCWTPVAEVLSADYDVVMVDARGHGRSDAPESGYGVAEQAVDLAGAIEGLGLVRPAVLGHSMGASATLVLASTYPDLPRAILLEDPPDWWVRPPDFGRWEARRAALVALKRQTREELIAERRREDPHWSEAELGPWADSKLRLSLNVLNRDAPIGFDWQAELARIECPALLITADPQLGAIVTEESAAALSDLIPQLEVAHVARAGHSIRRDQFECYMDVVSAFLEQVIS